MPENDKCPTNLRLEVVVCFVDIDQIVDHDTV